MKPWRRWGLQLSNAVRGNAGRVLGMNQRNLLYLYPNNPTRHLSIADDKLTTKQVLADAGVAVPETYRVYRHFFEQQQVQRELAGWSSFVVKPSKGRDGGGILVMVEQRDSRWIDITGLPYTAPELRKHILDIIFGVYSNDLQDAAIVEERVRQNTVFQRE